MKLHPRFWLAALAALLAVPLAQAGHYATITIDGNYADWAGVPIVDNDAGDNSFGPDIGYTQVAHDANYLYLRTNFPNSLSLETHLSIDVDESAATGFDVFGLGLVGSEVAWQNDFPYTQRTGVFNDGGAPDGAGLTGDFFAIGAALLTFDGVTWANYSDRELAIPLNIIRNQTGTLAFPDSTIRMLLWTDRGLGPDGTFDGLNGDVSGVINYTLAEAVVPEPTALALAGLSGLALVAARRRAAK